MPKIVTEAPDFALLVEADGNGTRSVVCQIRSELGAESHPVDLLAASQAAAAAIGGGITPAQVRAIWRQLAVQALIQAKTAGGW